MPFNLELPTKLKNARWKVKIFDKENREPPHITILQRTKKWRVDLRTGKFMDTDPPPREVPDQLLEIVRANWTQLIEEWDNIHPSNPVSGEDS